MILDGGGVRGAGSLHTIDHILQEIQTAVKNHPGLNHLANEPLKACDVFNHMAGTSTGGCVSSIGLRAPLTTDTASWRSYSEGLSFHTKRLFRRIRTWPTLYLALTALFAWVDFFMVKSFGEEMVQVRDSRHQHFEKR